MTNEGDDFAEEGEDVRAVSRAGDVNGVEMTSGRFVRDCSGLVGDPGTWSETLLS